MKKLISALVISAIPLMAFAQDFRAMEYQEHVFNVITLIITIALFMGFFLSIIKRVLDHRLKKMVVDKGVNENLVSSIIQTRPEENDNVNIKWFSILAGLGLGFLLIKLTAPPGIHSLAIMAFCISASYLGYYFFLKYEDKK